MPILFIFWGCPALRAGRAVSQLAGLLGPAALKRFGLALRATAVHPSAEALRAFAGGFAACRTDLDQNQLKIMGLL
ncbi:hypothetical protein SapgrDRAFT_2683 [Saprospira grandis DSM 2844]|uniref:Uncharacterized protein n=1 Tax=Saprospira grandis DSM 2844 TaxID=694433 RepID=J0P3F1_9BACT|nr:hypothetical protein SapgrDRAFT_2683 [Saprospira grandis DSM 2844]